MMIILKRTFWKESCNQATDLVFSKITVNPSVLKCIPAEARIQDVKLQRVHNSMIKAASSFSYISNTLWENMSEDDGTLTLSQENMKSLLDKSL